MRAHPLIRRHLPTAALRRLVPPTALAAGCGWAGLLAAASFAQAATPYTAYVANYGGETLTPINTATNATSSTIAVSSPQAIAITPDGATAYVCDWSTGKVTPINLTTNTAGTPITVGTNPSAIAITPDGTKAYVSNYNGNGPGTVTEITLSNDTTTTIPVGNGPYGVAITPSGTTAYVANHYDGTVTPITIATNTAGTAITVGTGGDVARTDWVAITTNGETAYAANYGSNSIVPIAIATNTAGTPITGVTSPNAIAISPDGVTAYIAEDGTPGHVVPMTLSNDSFGTPITVGNNPYDVAITPEQATAYVANYNNDGAGVVTPINLSSDTAETNVAVGTGPDSIAIIPDQAPLASFAVTPGPAAAPSVFDASASTVAYGTITSYSWNFGDGSAATTPTPIATHTYATAGSYTATLTETDSAGTSTTQVFTGQTMSRNGAPSAQATRAVSISAPLVSPLPVTVRSPARPTRVVLSTRSVRITAAGYAVFEMTCPADAREGCHGTITLRLPETHPHSAHAQAARCARGCRSLGSAKYEARAGQRIKVRVHIASFGRQLLARRKILRVSVTATSVAGQYAATVVRTIVLRVHGRAA